jgi:phosphoglycerate dehydrogenase-like enzyme
VKNLLLMYSNASPSSAHIERLKGLQADVSVVVAESEETAVRYAADTEIILGHRYLRQTLPHARRLEWVQSTAAGPHHLLTSEFRRIKPILTRCTAFSNMVAWHAFTLALSIVRRIPEAVKAQQQGIWAHSLFDMLPLPRTAMIFGVGAIGRELAAVLRKNGIAVLGVTRAYSAEAASVCDELFCGKSSWLAHLQRADLCFITLPLTRHTRNICDEPVLRALPRHSVLVNVGRAGVIDLPALIAILQEGRLGGAALDVLDPIPCLSDPVWSTPRLLITPKVSVFHPDRQRKLEAFMEDQVGRYLKGETLRDIVTIDNLAEGE